MDRTLDRMRSEQIDVLCVYADREHCANLMYLTGFDPRFEEALLLLSVDGHRKLLVGNECLGYLPEMKTLDLEVELFQEFSLLGQPRKNSRSLRTILRHSGVGAGTQVGCAGWKYFDDTLVTGAKAVLDVPAYLADALRELVGHPRSIVNATGLFMGVQDGLRVTNEPEQIAQFEYAAGVTSEGVLSVLRHLRPGVIEHSLEKYLDSGGLPLSCHRMIGFGDKAKRGLASPSSRRARLGDAYTIGFGVQGALNCRAGILAHKARDLPKPLREFYPRFVANYFSVVAAWYKSIRVGAKAGSVYRAAERARDKSLFQFAVNPGHNLHLDEWVHSPFSPGSKVILRSGMMLQMDIIPVSLGPFCCANAEDGVVLADENLRGVLAQQFPSMWRRIQARRRFMSEQLGLTLDDSVLPLSNTPAWFPHYALELDTVLVCNFREQEHDHEQEKDIPHPLK
jgi:Xaa-Pro aminopeptidase